MFRILLIFLAGVIFIPASSDSAPRHTTKKHTAPQSAIRDMAMFTGHCQVDLVGAGFNRCGDQVVMAMLSNGRVTVSFTVESTVVTMAGGHDQQPDLNHYTLFVDSMRINNGAKELAHDPNMEGACKFLSNDDGSVFYEIHCDVYDREKGMMSKFYLDDISKTDH